MFSFLLQEQLNVVYNPSPVIAIVTRYNDIFFPIAGAADANNGDQFFTATFNSNGGVGLPEFHPFAEEVQLFFSNLLYKRYL